MHGFSDPRDLLGLAVERGKSKPKVKREALSVVAKGMAIAAEVDAIHSLIGGTKAGPFLRMDRVGLG